ncbi:hypothetical protein GLAREA_11075 [Glarea lozoyensis ATCC 20868]|uniref:Uncharacterized protein n=1 Tax=Glarea lozoyensis (strain ATCC 20868 / MF5171) TaxID=1116229 RepID=S3DTW0_GLAL2|nr:uncharacterized protein GLAREA_11075 [Glarea lozoyensis ATCC 20868]EPE35376.1 hypothetical protein GLAREA_11075 [Glarea lozoyensis ATCC 20868]
MSLTPSTYFYGLEPSPPYPIKRSQASGRFRDVQPLPLETGSPYLRNPVIQTRGCKFCVPVLYYPAHCELHFHIREFIPENMRYCGECGKFTRSLAEKKYPTAIRAGNAGLRPAPLDVTPGLGANTLPVLTLEDRVTRIEGRVRELRESDERWPNSSSQLEFTPVDAAPVLLATDVPVEDALIELSDRIRRLEGRTVRERDAKERLSGSSGQQPTNTPSSQHSPRSKTALWELTSSDGRSAICGRCSVPYMQRYEGGRRMLNTRRPGQKLRVWYNREEEEDE